VIVEFLEGNIHAGRKEVVKDVICYALGLCLFHEEHFVIDTTRNHRIKYSIDFRHNS
jgi:hypothetical protein